MASLTEIWNQSSVKQEQALYEALIKTMPTMRLLTLQDNKNKLEIPVTSDYLSIEGLRISLMPATAQKVANFFGCILPTKKLVDKIWEASDIKLNPKSMSSNRGSLDTLRAHNDHINSQIGNRVFNIVSGHKKDIVINNKMPQGKVIIYGWHYPNGKAIQPESSVHGDFYKDYSHGTRLINRNILLNGVNKDIWEVVNSEVWEQLVGDKRFVEAGYKI